MSVSPCTFRQTYIEKGTVGMRPNMNHGREKKNQMLTCEIIFPTPCGEERGVVIRVSSPGGSEQRARRDRRRFCSFQPL